MEETHEKELLNIRAVAQMLDLGERTVWRMADSGVLPKPLKVGSRRKWRRRELLAWLDNGCPAVRRGVA